MWTYFIWLFRFIYALDVILISRVNLPLFPYIFLD